MLDESFPKELRLRSRADFRQVYERRCSVGDSMVRLVGRLNELDHSRIGLSVSREVGVAVVRNRWTRLLREASRLSRERLPIGLDFIAIPRTDVKPQLKGVVKSLDDLSWRLWKRLKRDESVARREKREEKSRAESQRREDDDN